MKKAIVFDRDGTLIKDKGYIKSFHDVEFYKIDINLMQILNKHFLFFIVSNQPGIGKGIISDDEVREVNLYIEKHFKEQNIHFTEIFYCPHSESEKCHCRKPQQLFMDTIKSKYKIDAPSSYMIGDHPSDIIFGQQAGFNSIYVLTGHGKKHRDELSKKTAAFHVTNNINSALIKIKRNFIHETH